MTMADGNRPTWEYVIPVAMAVVAWHSNGILQTLATGVCGGWVAILFAWHSGWRKVNKSE